MSNGRPWTKEAQALLDEGRPDAEINRTTGISLRSIQEHRYAAGIRYVAGPKHTSRREALMASAAGLDFQM